MYGSIWNDLQSSGGHNIVQKFKHFWKILLSIVNVALYGYDFKCTRIFYAIFLFQTHQYIYWIIKEAHHRKGIYEKKEVIQLVNCNNQILFPVNGPFVPTWMRMAQKWNCTLHPGYVVRTWHRRVQSALLPGAIFFPNSLVPGTIFFTGSELSCTIFSPIVVTVFDKNY